MPDGAELVIVLRGNLAAILTFASGKRKTEFLNERAILDKLLSRARRSKGKNAKSLVMGLYWDRRDIGCGGRI
ncbi:conserved hypothetical protein [Agrobacterium fabacearum TT111]|nr:conserved hypothetical protein [Agrobacterium fabacearum TT111]